MKKFLILFLILVFSEDILTAPNLHDELHFDESAICEYRAKPGNNILLNAGISGGSIEIYTDFLEEMALAFEKSSTTVDQSSDMAAFDWVLYSSRFSDKLQTGYPWHLISEIKRYFFIHKQKQGKFYA